MIISCIKSVTSFLDFFLNSKQELTTPPSLDPPAATRHLHNMLSPAHGLGLIAYSVTDSHANILESAAIRPPPLPVEKTVSGGTTFLDDTGGRGQSSVVESLGFGNSEERKVNDIEQLINHGSFFSGPNNSTITKKSTCEKRKEVKVFPPPISSLNDDGKPNFILHPRRKDGRLEISEVRIEHPEILRASREDGRLKLELVMEEEESDETGEEEIDPIEIKDGEEEEDEKFSVKEGGGDEGFRLCHDLRMWRNNHFHFVTIT